MKSINHKQKRIIIATILVFVAELLYSPTVRCTFSGNCVPTGKFSAIWDLAYQEQVNIPLLLIIWTATLLVGAVMFWISGDPDNAKQYEPEAGGTHEIDEQKEGQLRKDEAAQLKAQNSPNEGASNVHATPMWQIIVVIGIAAWLAQIVGSALLRVFL